MGARDTADYDWVDIHAERCTGCRVCQMMCSYTYSESFNPLNAWISVDRMDGFRIGFMEECIKCGICALHCAYGALKLKTEEPSKKG